MPTLSSKITRPRLVPHLVKRPRLLGHFSSRERVKVFIITAPAGYGKSILALQALARIPVSRGCWFHLDHRDIDIARFAGYLIRALSSAIPALAGEELTGKIDTGMSKPEEIAEDLCFFFQNYNGPDCWLVLDNWEEVDKSDEVRDFVATLINHTGEKLRFIVNSRVRPNLKIRKLQESGQAVILTQKELAFNYSEFVEALALRIETRLTEPDLEKLWSFTAGWCVNVGLIIELLKRSPGDKDRGLFDAINDSKSLFEYLEEELFNDISSGFLDFILRCSLLNTISEESCAAVIEERGKIKIYLKELADSTIPHFSLSQENTFRLHPLIKKGAYRILKKRVSNEELVQLHESVAEYYKNTGHLIESAKTLMDLPDYEAALKEVEENWFGIIEQNGFPLVDKWLSQFPEKYRNHPRFVKIMANVLTITGDNNRLATYLKDKIDPKGFEDGDTDLVFLWIRYYWALLHTTFEHEYNGVKYESEKLLQKFGALDNRQNAGVEHILSCAAYMDMDFETAITHMDKCIEYIGDQYFDYRMDLLDNKVIFYHMLGRSNEALDLLDSMLNECASRKSRFGLPHRLVNKAWIHYAFGEFHKGLEIIAESREVAAKYQSYSPRVEMYADQYEGIIRWYVGDRAESRRLLSRSMKLAAESNPKEVVLIGLYSEYFHLLDGQNVRLVEDKDLPAPGQKTESRLAYLVVEAARNYLSQNFSDAVKYAEELRDISKTYKRNAWVITADFILAYCHDMSGNDKLCRESLSEGLTILKQLQYPFYPMANDIITAFTVAKAVRTDIFPNVAETLVTGELGIELSDAFIRELEDNKIRDNEAGRLLEFAAIQKIRGLGKKTIELNERGKLSIADAARRYISSMESETIPKLNIRTFGEFSVSVNNRFVKFNRKNSRLLLLMLLAEWKRPVHEEVIIETLWPESNPAKGKTNLQTCVKDLRLALDPYHEPRTQSYIVYNDEHYSLNLPEGSYVDFIDFSEAIREILALKGARESLTVGQTANLRRALDICRGEFLPEQRYESFLIEFREKLWKDYQDGSLIYAEYAIKNGNFRDAIEILERGVDADKLWGEGVQTLMQARAANGEIFHALRAYRDYENRLREELDLPPDEDMRGFLENLLNYKN